MGCLVAVAALCFAFLVMCSMGSQNPTDALKKEDGPRPWSGGGSNPSTFGARVSMTSDGYCAPTPEALTAFVRWQNRKDPEEMMRVVRGHPGGRLFEAREAAKVLDPGVLQSRVRLLRDDLECWVIPEVYR